MVCPVGFISFNIFLVVFEGIMNCYAELSCFGDRLFYEDFWNSTNFDEFNRKWNRRVHEFLKHYVYRIFTQEFGFTKFQGYVATLVYSAIFHEFLLVFS